MSVCSVRYFAFNAHTPYFHVACPAVPYFSTLSHKLHDFWKKKLNIKRDFIFSANIVCNISHSKKNWARYDQKCILVFVQNTVSTFLLQFFWHYLAILEYCCLTNRSHNLEPREPFKVSHLLCDDTFLFIFKFFICIVLHYFTHSWYTVSFTSSQQITNYIFGNVKINLEINDLIQKNSVQPHLHVHVALLLRLPCFMPFAVTPLADIPFLNLRRIFVGLTPFGSLRPITLIPTCLFRYFFWECFFRYTIF